MAIGAQSGFDWKGVAKSASAGGVSGGVGGMSGMNAIANAALSNVITQGVYIATGLQNGFEWRNVAASAAGAAVGGQVSGALKDVQMSALLKATATGFAAGTAAALARGGKTSVVQIATDAFGNALGNSLAAELSGARSAQLEADQKRSGYEEAAYEKAAWAARSGVSSAVSSGGTWWDDDGAYPNGTRLRFFMGGPAAAGAAGADGSPLTAAEVLGASAIVDGMPQVFVPGPGPSWIERNILSPVGHIASNVGNVLADVGKGFLKWADDTFVRPSGSTDEIPQNFQYNYRSQAGNDSGYRPLSSYRPVGPAFAAIDPAKEAMARAQSQRVGNNLSIWLGVPFVALPMLVARGIGRNETDVGEAGYLGASLQELAGVRGSGMRFPSVRLSGAPTISLSINGANSAATSPFVTTPTRASVRELKDFGLDSAQRRSFFEGKQVIFEDPATAFETATIFKLGPDTLHAGVYDIISDGSGAVLSFANRSRSLGNSLGVKNLDLFGADIQNAQLQSLLVRRGFEPGAPVRIDAFGFDKYVETLRKTEVLRK